MIEAEVCVIGAGPGGSAASLFLSKAGLKCVLVDKAKFPRDKICGDAISGKVVEVFRKLDDRLLDQLNAHPEVIGSWGVKFIAPNLSELKVPFKKDYNKQDRAPGFLAKRFHFDDFLFQQVKKNSNVQIMEECELVSFKRENEYWILSDKKGVERIKTRLVIAADGAHSFFAKTIGGIEVEKAHYCAGLRAYYKNVKGLDEDNFIELHFLKDFLPGYFWIFPLANGYANVGVGMRSDKVSRKKLNLKKSMLQIIAQHPQFKERFANAELIDEIRGYGLPLGSKKRKLSGVGFMLVGDAASLIDPFTGEGIGNAMMSGMIAAETAAKCLQSENFSASFLKEYDVAVYKRLWAELKLSYRLQQLAGVPWLFNLVVNRANQSNFLREAIMSMFEDIELRKKLRNPKTYFRLIFNRY